MSFSYLSCKWWRWQWCCRRCPKWRQLWSKSLQSRRRKSQGDLLQIHRIEDSQGQKCRSCLEKCRSRPWLLRKWKLQRPLVNRGCRLTSFSLIYSQQAYIGRRRISEDFIMVEPLEVAAALYEEVIECRLTILDHNGSWSIETPIHKWT